MPVVIVPVNNHIVARLQKLSLALIVCALACVPTLTAKAQAFPAFPNGNNNGFTNQGVSMGLAQFASATANSLLMVYTTVGSPNVLALASSTNGTNFTPLQTLPGYSVYQHSNDPQAANAAICVFNGNAYIAYADNATDGLYVLKLSIIPGSSQFSVALAHTETGLHLTAAPGMAVAPDGRHLLIRYPTSSVSGVNNGTFTTEFDGITWNTQQSFGLTPQQPALIVFNSKLYAIDKQNNSGNGIFVSQLNNDGVYISGTAYQIPGCLTYAGLAAVVYKNEILVVNQSSNSSQALAMCASTDGVNWTGYTATASNYLDGAPAAALFNGGVTVAYQSNNGNQIAFTTHAN